MYSIDQSILIVIDVQDKIAPLMCNKEHIYTNIPLMIKAMKILDIPIIYTEQVPAKLGKTVSEVNKMIPDLIPVEKNTFSCCGKQEFLEMLSGFKRDHIIITGIETHVCVYQTAADLLDLKYDVSIITDGVSSKSIDNKNTAIEHMRKMGANITCGEMMILEMVRSSEHPKFKDILGLIKE